MSRTGDTASAASTQTDRSTLIAFFVLVVIGGSNAVAVRFSNGERAEGVGRAGFAGDRCDPPYPGCA